MDSLDFQVEDFAQTSYLLPLQHNRKFPLKLDNAEERYQRIWKEMQEIILINEEKPIGYQLQTKAAIYKIIVYLLQENLFVEEEKEGDKGSNASNLKKLLVFMHENYTRKIYLKDVAKVIHVSPKYFCTYFKDKFGKSFVEYLNHLRVEHACILLATTQQSAMEIALQVGFENLSYFIRTFKRITGSTPNAYRKKH